MDIKPIKTKTDYRETLKKVESLMGAKANTANGERLDILVTLIEAYERFRAVAAQRPGRGLIHHSDRGSQYCAQAYQKLLQQFGMQSSMSRKGNC